LCNLAFYQSTIQGESEGIKMADDEKTIEIILEEGEKRYNLTLVLIAGVFWLVCLVCVLLMACGLLWLIGVL
jgi:hypothetical protein